jgi:hypothetical protein
MTATYYDPDEPPDPREWLALDEWERVRLTGSYHQAARIRLPDTKAHALIHAIVENQIAQGFGPSCRALERLQNEGLSRHEAVHAVGSVVSNIVYGLRSTSGGGSAEDKQRKLATALEALPAKAWRREP